MNWELWMDLLQKEGLLAPGAVSMAYSYIGPQVTQAVYRHGTNRQRQGSSGKDRPEAGRTSQENRRSRFHLVTRPWSPRQFAIPFMPLYISLLYKVMKAKGIHEGTLEQMDRLFRSKLYSGKPVSWTRRTASAWTIGNCARMCSGKWISLAARQHGQCPGHADIAGYRGDFHRLVRIRHEGVTTPRTCLTS